MSQVALPVACSLTEPELQERRRTVIGKAKDAILEVREVADGYAYQFPATDEWLTELAVLISLERRCCPFLHFKLTLEPAQGPVWLELTGPEGTKAFLAGLFS